jgi:hypothetical protein
MKYLSICLTAFLLTSVSPQAVSMNRCTAANGAVSFQDKPCDGQGQVINPVPASGNAPAKQSRNPSNDGRANGFQAQKDLADRLRRERLVRDGNWEAASLNSQLNRLSRDCATIQKQHTETLNSSVDSPSAQAKKRFALEQLISNERTCSEQRNAIHKEFNRLERP